MICNLIQLLLILADECLVYCSIGICNGIIQYFIVVRIPDMMFDMGLAHSKTIGYQIAQCNNQPFDDLIPLIQFFPILEHPHICFLYEIIHFGF